MAATKYPNNLMVEINEPIDTKYVCNNLSDLTDYLYVGLMTYCKSDNEYYSLESFDSNKEPIWRKVNTRSINIQSGTGIIYNSSDGKLVFNFGDGLNPDENGRINVNVDPECSLTLSTNGLGLKLSSNMTMTDDNELDVKIYDGLTSTANGIKLNLLEKGGIVSDAENNGAIKLNIGTNTPLYLDNNNGGALNFKFDTGNGAFAVNENNELTLKLHTINNQSILGEGNIDITSNEPSTVSVLTGNNHILYIK